MSASLFRPTTPAPPRHGGFTLLELIITMTVLVVSLAVVAPSFNDFVANNQMASVRSSFASTLALARSEAARTGTTVILQAASGGNAGNLYANGWSLYLDVSGTGVVSAGDTLLRQYAPLSPKVALNGAASINFSPSGYLTPAASATYTICRTDGTAAGYSVVVAASGMTFVSAITTCAA